MKKSRKVNTEINAETQENDESIVEKISNIIFTVILIAAILFTAYVMINSARGRAVRVFGKSVLKVVTGSMEPSIHVDDYIVVEKINASDVKKDDIISFYSEEEDIKGLLVTHRVISVNEDGTFTTKGDANSTTDRLSIRPDQLCGKYVGRAKFFNWVKSFASAKKLLMLLVIIPLLAISLYEVKSLAKVMKQVEKEKAEDRDARIKKESEDRIAKLKAEALAEYLEKEKARELDRKAREAEEKARQLRERAERVKRRAEEIAKQLEELNAGEEEVKIFIPEKAKEKHKFLAWLFGRFDKTIKFVRQKKNKKKK